MASTSKTRDKMVEVSRELFAKRGIQATTMNDIADAAGKGRRTLYTYFRSKEDIYQAVVKCELTQFLHDMEIARRINLPPEQKLINLIYVHLESVKNIVLRNGTLRAEFFRDIWLVEKARADMDKEEQKLIQEILDEGVHKGIFEIPHTPTMSYLMQNAIKGMEVPYISGHIRQRDNSEYQSIRENVVHLILRGIRKKAWTPNSHTSNK